jgi:hypothetical protein
MNAAPIVIGIAGLARSGKDTLADELQKHLDFSRYSFAAPLKQMIEVGLGLKDKEEDKAQELYDCTYRHIAQTLGTEWGRALVKHSIWTDIAVRRLQGKQVIISDVRFNNEAEWVREHGILVHLVRPNQELVAESGHTSESGIDSKHGDYRVINTGGLEDFLALVPFIAKDLEQLLSYKKLWADPLRPDTHDKETFDAPEMSEDERLGRIEQ